MSLKKIWNIVTGRDDQQIAEDVGNSERDRRERMIAETARFLESRIGGERRNSNPLRTTKKDRRQARNW